MEIPIKPIIYTWLPSRCELDTELQQQPGYLFHLMSHTFPQLIQSAAVVLVQISMSDLALDVALMWHATQLVSCMEPQQHSQSD